MARLYTCSFAFVTSALAPVSMMTILSGTLHCFDVLEVEMTSDDVSGVKALEYNITRITTAGTGTALTPSPHMTDDTAFTGTAKSNCTVEPAKGTVGPRGVWNPITPEVLDYNTKPLSAYAGAGDGYAFILLTAPSTTKVSFRVEIREN